MRKLYIFRILYVLFLFAGAISCENLDADRYGSQDIPDGETTLSAVVDFKSFIEALDGSTKSAGDAIKEIENLCVIVYDKDNNYTQSQYFDKNALTISHVDRTPADFGAKDEDGTTDRNNAESQTPRATFKFTIPYGIYSIYVVANMGDLSADNNYNDDIQTIQGLKNISLNWQSNDISKNNQMFGYFTAGDNNTNGEQITINKPGMELHAWLKRAASKVTVAFNGKQLNENVFITIKSVQIKDIPASCLLFNTNVPNAENELIADGETISYENTSGEFPIITKGGANFGSVHQEGWMESDGNTPKDFDPTGTNGVSHLETSPALYFFENMQGLGESGSSTDKSLNKLEYNTKGKAYGTYIEVKGYYENKNMGSVTSGDIIYRFMLGKNVTTNYDAERNHHYKVTLCFKNDANDVDWRIEYDEKIGIYLPNPYYISYLYNQSMEMPLKVVIPDNELITSIKAEIIENNWEPDGDVSVLGESYYGNATTNIDSGKKYYSAPGNGGTEVKGYLGEGNTNIPWVGFLSLLDEYDVVNHGVADADKKIHVGELNPDFSGYYKENSAPYAHWMGNGGDNKLSLPLGVKDDYYLNKELYGFDGYKQTGSNTHTASFHIPFYTRLKQLYSASGFVGNNPFVAFNRKAKVRITVITSGGKTYSEDVTIIQVKRLVNPTGIWRSSNNAESFNVTLMDMTLQSMELGNFTPLVSDGPWTAKVIQGADWILLNGKLNNTVTGQTGSYVQFSYKPSSTIASDEVRCGIIEVTYHDNSCIHRIFVRQGYEPLALGTNEAKWYSFNMLTNTSMTSSPLDEGSFFRYGKPEYPISEKNNLDSRFSYGVNPGDNKFAIEGTTTTMTWNEISSKVRTDAFTFAVNNARLPYLDEYKDLLHYDNGYGVLYADGATEVATNTTEAFAYRRHASISETQLKKRGMRGVFIYNINNGNNIFFPIGAVGYGHRKHQASGGNYGMLRYGTVNIYITSPYRPLLYNLISQYGAIYWTGGTKANGYTGDGWDINFDQLDFNEYTYSNAFASNSSTEDNGISVNQSNALFVRCVVGTR